MQRKYIPNLALEADKEPEATMVDYDKKSSKSLVDKLRARFEKNNFHIVPIKEEEIDKTKYKFTQRTERMRRRRTDNTTHISLRAEKFSALYSKASLKCRGGSPRAIREETP